MGRTWGVGVDTAGIAALARQGLDAGYLDLPCSFLLSLLDAPSPSTSESGEDIDAMIQAAMEV